MALLLQSKNINKPCKFANCPGVVRQKKRSEKRPPIVIYTRMGTQYAHHVESRCTSCERGNWLIDIVTLENIYSFFSQLA